MTAISAGHSFRAFPAKSAASNFSQTISGNKFFCFKSGQLALVSSHETCAESGLKENIRMRNISPSTSRFHLKGARSHIAFAVLIVGTLMALPLFIGSAGSPIKPIANDSKITSPMSANSHGAITTPNLNFLEPLLPAGPVTLATFAGDCTTSKTVFNVQDTDKTVCAQFTNAQPGWRLIWSNAKSVAVQTVTLTTGNGSATFTLNTNSSLGDWRVILLEPFGGTVQAVTSFTVIDAANPTADLAISKGPLSNTVSAGGQALFALQVTNLGPSSASAVQISDDVPANTTFVSFSQLDGPTFSCSPNEGETGSTICTIASLARGETATFVATYLVGNVANGSIISNTATVSSSTTDPVNPDVNNNVSTAGVEVTNAACQLSTPGNITTDADTGQAGAMVTYTTPTGTGNCGTTTTGENGETIPAISCNPASGSFFPVGTSTVICTAQTGSAVSFQVTVNNPGALSISLSGSNSLTLECGQRFGDPGATAINGSGQSLDVSVSYSNGFDPDNPAVGTYPATYTATEGANSVSAERTLVVTDTEGPAITINGANP